jgi:hypothetical protein
MYIWLWQCWNRVPHKHPVALDLCAHVNLIIRPASVLFHGIVKVEKENHKYIQGMVTVIGALQPTSVMEACIRPTTALSNLCNVLIKAK